MGAFTATLILAVIRRLERTQVIRRLQSWLTDTQGSGAETARAPRAQGPLGRQRAMSGEENWRSLALTLGDEVTGAVQAGPSSELVRNPRSLEIGGKAVP